LDTSVALRQIEFDIKFIARTLRGKPFNRQSTFTEVEKEAVFGFVQENQLWRAGRQSWMLAAILQHEVLPSGSAKSG
jgi:hypothetical protein